MVAGETGATGAHAVFRVGLALESGAENVITQPQAPVASHARDFLCRKSLVTKDSVLVCVKLEFD